MALIESVFYIYTNEHIAPYIIRCFRLYINSFSSTLLDGTILHGPEWTVA